MIELTDKELEAITATDETEPVVEEKPKVTKTKSKPKVKMVKLVVTGAKLKYGDNLYAADEEFELPEEEAEILLEVTANTAVRVRRV